MELLSLNILIFSPLLMVLFYLLPIFKGHEVVIRRSAKGFAVVHFLYTLMFWLFYNPENTYNSQLNFFGQHGIDTLGIKYAFQVDGLSLVFVLLTSLLVLLATIMSKLAIRNKHKLYYSLIFLLQVAILGVFTSADMYLFFFFWELELIPMYFLISLWGSGNSQKSAMKFLIYTFIGSLFMLLGILFIHYFNYNFNLHMTSLFDEINILDNLPINIQILISILLLIGFAVKLPIIPFHTWLPDAHVDAPTPISMLLAGLLLKLGAYGIIKFNISLLPDAFKLIAPILMILAIINILHAGFLAYYQDDTKKIVAYSSISMMGIVLLGLTSINQFGFDGAVFHMFSHGLISAGLFVIVGIIYQRMKTRSLTMLGGLGKLMPTLMGFGIIISLANIGVPLLMGFIGEFLVFWGVFNAQLEAPFVAPIVIFSAMLIIILSTVYMLKFLHGIFFGIVSKAHAKINDISAHEFVVLSIISVGIIFFGIFPMSIIDMVNPVLLLLLESVGI